MKIGFIITKLDKIYEIIASDHTSSFNCDFSA